MFDAAFDASWHKDKKITCSDWGVTELSLPQIKYAALDAWTSSELGIKALETYHTRGIYKMIFATTDADLALRVNDELFVKQLIRQARELEDMNIKVPKNAEVDNLRAASADRPNSLQLSCSTYENRVSNNIQKVEIRIISPGGSDGGISFFAEVVENKTKGKVSNHHLSTIASPWSITPAHLLISINHCIARTVTLLDYTMVKVSMIDIDLASIDEIEATSEVDRHRVRELKHDLLRTIISYWQDEDNQLGRYAKRTLNRRDQIRRSAMYVRVRFYCHEQPDPLLQQVRLTISDFVRSHFAPLDFFPPQVVDAVVAERNAIAGLKVGTSTRTIYSLGIDLLSLRAFNNTATHPLTEAQEEAIETHIETLNFAQGVALQNAFSHRVSVIKGPPGTGKTRTMTSVISLSHMYFFT